MAGSSFKTLECGVVSSRWHVVPSRMRKSVVVPCILGAMGILALNVTGPIRCRVPDARQNAKTGARILRAAVQSWQAGNSLAECPTLAQLKSKQYVDPGQSVTDSWGTEYEISCANDEITISSAGADRRWGTGDDISVPPR